MNRFDWVYLLFPYQSKIQGRFRRWNTSNQTQSWTLFPWYCEWAINIIAAGRIHCSVRTLCEVLIRGDIHQPWRQNWVEHGPLAANIHAQFWETTTSNITSCDQDNQSDNWSRVAKMFILIRTAQDIYLDKWWLDSYIRKFENY